MAATTSQIPGQDLNNLFAANSTSNRSASPPSQHRRGYQACDPCRLRKVKCDLGPVDAPRPPPCVRCRRESKDCLFSATRRKRQSSEFNADDGGSGHRALQRDKKRMTAESSYNPSDSNGVTSFGFIASPSYTIESGSPQQWPSSAPRSGDTPQPLSRQGYGVKPRSRDGRAPLTSLFTSSTRSVPAEHQHPRESGQHMMNKTAADLLSPAIANSHDALHLLSEAAGRSEDLNRRSHEGRFGSQKSPSTTFNTPTTTTAQLSRAGTLGKDEQVSPDQMPVDSMFSPGLVDPCITNNAGSIVSLEIEDADFVNGLKAWSRLRFVRAGWFTNREAMAYITYYYKHLAPVTPIVPPDFSSPSSHIALLTEEPILTVAMLTIAARHMKLTGPGANSRAYSIHEKLWSYLRGMIERLFWGQEQFGGGFCGAGPTKFREANPTGGRFSWKGSLRSLGTIEALLLLTDWHPRALHFPPGDDENTLVDMDDNLFKDVNGSKEEYDEPDPGLNKGRLAFASWLEPAWRSDRMCWMLLGNAQALAFELGVFDKKHDLEKCTDHSDPTSDCARKRRVRRLMLVYVSQNSGRLGITSMLPLPQWQDKADRARSTDPTDVMQGCWMEIASLMFKINEVLFPTKEHTRDLVRTGQYRDSIDNFNPNLRDWKARFDKLQLRPLMRSLLTIEYEYTRLYVNSLALQAVVDRWTHISNEEAAVRSNSTNAKSGVGTSGAASGAVPFSVLMELYKGNEQYIEEVADACRSILRTVIDGLLPDDYIRHAPVRTYFRILSAMIFLLKTFALGAKEDEVRISLNLLDKTVECLRTSVVDDVHLSITIADLLQSLTSSIRTRFLRFAAADRGPDSESHDRTPMQNSRQQTPHHQRPEQAQDYSIPQSRGQGPNYSQTYGYGMDSNHPAVSYHDPLAGIPAQQINLNSSNLNISFMPPPSSVYNNYYDPNNNNNHTALNTESDMTPQPVDDIGSGSGGGGIQGMSDWFALPLDPFFNSTAAAVDQGFGGIGPVVGDYDMLEVMLGEQYDKDNMGGGFMGFGN